MPWKTVMAFVIVMSSIHFLEPGGYADPDWQECQVQTGPDGPPQMG